MCENIRDELGPEFEIDFATCCKMLAGMPYDKAYALAYAEYLENQECTCATETLNP